eukprot:1153855-Pelagomonas_calceolata.AAC.1
MACFCLGAHLGHTCHIQMYAPAKVMSRLSGCACIQKRTMFLSACLPKSGFKYLGTERVRHKQTKVSKEVQPSDDI